VATLTRAIQSRFDLCEYSSLFKNRDISVISQHCIEDDKNVTEVILLVLLTDEDGVFETRIESLDSTRVEDMVHEYFAKADEVSLLLFLFLTFCFWLF